MACPRCGRSDVARIRRRGLLHRIAAFFGRWPYSCRNCRKRFYRGERRLADPYPGPLYERRDGPDNRCSGPQMAFRADPVRPTAKIVLETDTHSQMNEILLALNRAVERYRQPVKEHANSER